VSVLLSVGQLRRLASFLESITALQHNYGVRTCVHGAETIEIDDTILMYKWDSVNEEYVIMD
jgi:hypothetical protein